MPHLLIDIGNSLTKYALYSEDRLSPVKKIKTTLLERDVHLIDVCPSELLRGITLVSVEQEKLTINIINKLEKYYKCSINRIKTQRSNFGVTCGYDDYLLLGDDRWVAMLAAFKGVNKRIKTKPLLVIDCGSVVTVDVIEHSGLHAGGWMIPNSQLMTTVLIQKSEGIRRALQDMEQSMPIEKQAQGLPVVPGRSTGECVEQGNRLAITGFIGQCFEQTKNKYNNTPYCVITGGGAEKILTLFSMHVEYRPNLIFDGLALFIE